MLTAQVLHQVGNLWKIVGEKNVARKLWALKSLTKYVSLLDKINSLARQQIGAFMRLHAYELKSFIITSCILSFGHIIFRKITSLINLYTLSCMKLNSDAISATLRGIFGGNFVKIERSIFM